MKKVSARSGQLARSASRRGKSPSRFQFDVTIDRVFGVKAGGSYQVKWSRGVKVAATKVREAARENAGKGGLPFDQKISLLVTLYREDGKRSFDPKDAKISLVSINAAKRQERTVAKLHFDLSEFAGIPSSSTAKTFKLSDKVSIRAVVDSRFTRSGGGGPGSGGASSVLSGLSGVSGRSSDDDGEDEFGDLALDDVPEPEVFSAKSRAAALPSSGSSSRGGAAASSASASASQPRVPLLVETTSGSTNPKTQLVPPVPSLTPPASQPRSNHSSSQSSAADKAAAAEAAAALAKLQAEHDQLNIELRRSQDKRRRLEATHKEELEKFRNELGAAQSNVASRSAEALEGFKERNAALEIESMRQRSELDSLRRERDELQIKAQDVNTLEQKNRDLTREVDRITVALATAGSATSADSRSTDQSSNEVEARIRAVRSEKEALEAKLKAHQGHALKVKETYQKLSVMYNELREDNVNLQKEVEEAKGKESENVTRAVAAATSGAAASATQRDTAYDEIKVQLQDAEQALKDMEATKESLQSDYDRTSGQISSLQERLDRASQSLADSQSECDDLHAEVDELKSQRDAALKRALSKGRTLSASDESLSSTAAKEAEELKITKDKIERELARANARAEELQSEMDGLSEDIEYEKSEKAKAREERDALRESARALERRTSEAALQSDAMHSLKRKVSAHQMREQDHEAMISDLRDEVNRLQDELDDARDGETSHTPSADVDEVNEVLQVLVATKMALAEAEDEKLNLQFSMKTLKKTEKQQQERLAAHASRLEVQLGQATEELDTLRKKYDTHELGSDVDY